MILLKDGTAIFLSQIESVERVGNTGACYIYTLSGNKIPSGSYKELMALLHPSKS